MTTLSLDARPSVATRCRSPRSASSVQRATPVAGSTRSVSVRHASPVCRTESITRWRPGARTTSRTGAPRSRSLGAESITGRASSAPRHASIGRKHGAQSVAEQRRRRRRGRAPPRRAAPAATTRALVSLRAAAPARARRRRAACRAPPRPRARRAHRAPRARARRAARRGAAAARASIACATCARVASRCSRRRVRHASAPAAASTNAHTTNGSDARQRQPARAAEHAGAERDDERRRAADQQRARHHLAAAHVAPLALDQLVQRHGSGRLVTA